MLNFIEISKYSIFSALAFVLFGFVSSRIFKRNDIADVLWGLGFLLTATVHLSASATLTFRTQLLVALLTLWSMRLSVYLGIRTFSKTEDVRYKTWRDEWGRREPIMAFLKVFLLQGAVLIFVAIPIPATIWAADSSMTVFDFLGLGLFLLGFIWESIADWELFAFKKNNLQSGQILTSGLWNLCRHPNYLGEALIWWGFGFVGFAATLSYWIFISPLLITFLLLKVSGVPMLEKHLKNKANTYKEITKSIPAFVPFSKNHILVFFAIMMAFVILDFIWLGVLFAEFYKTEALPLARMKDGQWNVWLWPALGVYICLALAVQTFAIAKTLPQTLFKGFLLGLCIYGVYDLTNLSLLRDWPMRMALIDMAWGPFLCAMAAATGYQFTATTKNL